MYFLQEEINQILATGASPDRIIYAHPTKEPSHLNYAWEKGVNLTVFDNEDELYKIHKLSPKMRYVSSCGWHIKAKWRIYSSVI